MDINKNQLLMDAIECAHLAGKIQLSYFRKQGLQINAKLNESDVVTQADKESERIIKDYLHSKYPTHSILSEESGEENHSSDFLWVIDPLDGTTNFSSGLPLFCVSIGLKYKNETIIGVVYAPYINELFHSIKGEGAFLNGEPIHCSTKDEIYKAVFSTGFPVDKCDNPDNNIDNLQNILPLVRGIRRNGSAAIDISYVAAGFQDGFWELNLHEWDVCAALLIANEAGALYWNFRNDRNISVLVTNKALGDVVLPLLNTKPRT